MSNKLYNRPVDNNSNNNKHEKTKKILKIVGPIVLVFGLVGFVTGIVLIFSSEENFVPFIWLPSVSVFLIFIGFSLSAFAYRREVARYLKNDSIPIINEASEELKPSFKNIASAFNDGKNDTKCCPKCGQKVDDESKFCTNCGTPLTIICPNCHTEVEPGKFCSNCGKPLDSNNND